MVDLKNTLFLPKTAFAMRGNLAEKEPSFCQKWREQKLYQKLREHRKGRKPFYLHWGPPYANGHLHAGHALNGILKDILVRIKSLEGYDAPLVPGWDCHGLPIEWKIEESLTKSKKKKSDLSPKEFRQLCRDFARNWVQVQSEEFERIGILSDLENPYLTMKHESEAAIARAFLDHLEKGYVARGERPIMWSVVEQTALAEAEIEYKDKESYSVHVAFAIKHADHAALKHARMVIWTTTPWTLPGNRAIAYGPDLNYVVLEVQSIQQGSQNGSQHLRPGDCFVVAEDLVEGVSKHLQIENKSITQLGRGADVFSGVICEHPLCKLGYDFDVPLLPGDHVTTEAGTGLVHTAPAHGPDDFYLGKKHGLEIADTVQDNGLYKPCVKEFAGLHIFKTEPLIMSTLESAGALLSDAKIMHSYPHSWRSKKPLIYRTTPQWFISLDKSGIRQSALNAIQETRFVPAQGENRIRAMIADRPDWCVSRQRAWGVPLPLILNKETHEPIVDVEVNQKIIQIFEEEGSDAWFERDLSDFLTASYDPDAYQKVMDILDVWFESGATQSYVLEARPDLERPADLYLEGSDQHRGWFQSSLLIGSALYGDAPFKDVLTHGFVLDEQGYKMSKSKGDALSPMSIAQSSGIEILRLWVASTDYGDDVKLGQSMLKSQQDIYRRFRNTLRYLLGALEDKPSLVAVDYQNLPTLEKFILGRLAELQEGFKEMSQSYNFQEFYRDLHHFCAVDLSALYFDVRKDSLYCDGSYSALRQATLFTMNQLLHHLVKFLAPVLCFTSEEAWQTLYPESESVHLEEITPCPAEWSNQDVIKSIEDMREVRSEITAALEQARRDGIIGSSLEAKVTIKGPENALFDDYDFAELAIVSALSFEIDNDLSQNKIDVQKSTHEKCERCWKVLVDVKMRAIGASLCNRCDDVVTKDFAQLSPTVNESNG